MAPSLETLIFGGYAASLPTPAHIIVALHHNHNPIIKNSSQPSEASTGELAPNLEMSRLADEVAELTPTKQKKLVNTLLKTTTTSFLVSKAPLQSSSHLPKAILQCVPPYLKPNFSITYPKTLQTFLQIGKHSEEEKALEAETMMLWKELRKAEILNQVQTAIIEGGNTQLIM